MKKKLLTIILIAALAGAGWKYRFSIYGFFGKLPKVSNVLNADNILSELKRDIFTPDPLRSSENHPSSFLTRAGTIAQTNIQRKLNGNLPALTEDRKLNLAAEAKVKDMFAKQYFEHISPEGVGPADLATQYGYAYIISGENLALGNFKDDAALVEAWMNSPGHRANILNAKYINIGVAVGKGSFEGKTVWLAVQEFGRPLSACPNVDAELKNAITVLEKEIKAEETELKILKQELAESEPHNREEYEEYNRKVEEYNARVRIYNSKVETVKELIEKYNNQVKQFNECAG